MSRRFAEVGVGIDAARLREIAAGAPAAEAELTDVEFAVLASGLRNETRLSTFERAKHACLRGLLVAGMGLVMLSSLLCVTWLMLSMMLQTRPF